MNAFTSVEAAQAVSTNAIGLPAQGRRRLRWDDVRVAVLCDLLRDDKTFDEIAEAFDLSRNCIAGQVHRMRLAGDARLPEIRKRGRRPAGNRSRGAVGSLRRFGTIKPKGHGIELAATHPAVLEARPLFPGKVLRADQVKRVLISGENSRKIGKRVMKGPRRGWPILTLTLPERSTCPTTCQAWRACYGNGMNWAQRIVPDQAFQQQLWTELADLQRKRPGGFLVRLHVLGDFFSEDYVDLIDRALDAFPAFHAFGFTARDPDTDEIGSALWALTQSRWDRFSIRFSGMAGPIRASRVIEHGADDPEAIVCPAQTEATPCCATCGLCFSPSFDRSIAFWKH